jgi:predicted dinucleotide-binding enzyme
MNIAVIGGGGVGETLARAWARGGHAVEFGVREPASEKSRKLASASGIPVKSNRDAAAAAQVIVLATPWRATREAVAACGDLAGKIVIDCTNPLNATFRIVMTVIVIVFTDWRLSIAAAILIPRPF